MSEKNPAPPKPSGYMNVFLYLQDLYAYRKKINPAFSYEVWSSELGLRSRSFLRMVVVGKRTLTENFVNLFCTKSSLGEHEENYFRTLTSYCQAKSLTQKRIIEKKLIELLRFDGDRVKIENHFEFMSSALLPKLQTLLSFDDVPGSAENIGEILNCPQDQITKGIERLCELNLVEANESQGQVKWRSKNKRIQVGNHLGDAAMVQFHTQSLQEAIQAQHLPAALRRFRSLHIPLSPQEFNEVLEEVEVFVRLLLGRYKSDSLKGKRIYQVNLNLVPITEEADRFIPLPPENEA